MVIIRHIRAVPIAKNAVSPYFCGAKSKNQNQFRMEKYPHYLERLQNATRKYWEKAALNSIGGESFTYGQMPTKSKNSTSYSKSLVSRRAKRSLSTPATAPAGV